MVFGHLELKGMQGNFWLMPNSNKRHTFLLLMSLKLIWNLPKFRTQPLVIEFEFQNMSKQVPNAFIQFKMHHTHLELVIFGCL